MVKPSTISRAEIWVLDESGKFIRQQVFFIRHLVSVINPNPALYVYLDVAAVNGINRTVIRVI